MKYQILIVLLFGISTPFIVRSQVPALVPIHVDNKWGFCDTNTAMIIPAIYDEVGRFKQWGGPDSGVWYAEVNNRPFVQWIDKNGAPFILLDSISSIKATPRAQKLWGITISRMNNGVWQNWTAIADDQLHFLTPFYRSITNIDHNRYIAELPNEPGRYGVFNMKNRLVRRFEYQPTSNIYNGVIGVSRKGTDGRTEYGFANLKEKLIIPFQYWSIYTFWGTFGVCLRPNLQWEVIDMKGRIYSTIDSNLEKNIWRYPNHIFIKKTNGKWQGFDANGKPFLKENLDYPPGWVEKDDQYYYKILSDSTYIFMDMNGQELARHPYPWVEPAEIKKGSYGTTYSDDLCRVFNKKEKVGLARRTSLFGLKELIPPIYDSFFEFENGLAIVKKAGLFGVVDTTGRLILPTLYDHIYIERRTDNPFIQVVINDKMGLFDADGREIAPCIFSQKRNDPPPQLMKATLNGMTWWSDGGHFAKAFDSTYTIDLRYTPPSVAYIPIRKADKMGILNRQFNWVVQPIFDHCQISYNGQRLVTRDSAVWSIRDAKTLEVLFSSPEKIWIKGNDVFSSIATNLNYWNDTLRQFLPVPYQLESEFQDGRALARCVNRKFGFVDQNMQLVIPCQFDLASLFKNQYAIVKVGSKYGIIDINGHYLLPLEYDHIKRLTGGYFLIKKDLKDTLPVTPPYFDYLFARGYYRCEQTYNLLPSAEEIFRFPDELFPPFTVLDSTGRSIVENCELVFPEPEGLGYVKNGIYEEYGVSADQPLKLLPKLFYKDKISDSLTIYNMETSFECTPNYGISGACNSSGVRIGSISTFKAIQGYHKIYMANQTGKYAVFTHEGKQLSGYIFPPNYLNMYNSNPLPFCESSYTHWVTYSGKEICPIK